MDRARYAHFPEFKTHSTVAFMKVKSSHKQGTRVGSSDFLGPTQSVIPESRTSSTHSMTQSVGLSASCAMMPVTNLRTKRSLGSIILCGVDWARWKINEAGWIKLQNKMWGN